MIDACRSISKRFDEGDACLAFCVSMKTCQELSLLPRELPSDLTPYLVQASTRAAINTWHHLIAQDVVISISDRKGAMSDSYESQESAKVDKYFPHAGCRFFEKEHFSRSSRGCTPALLCLMRSQGWMHDVSGSDNDSDNDSEA